MSKSFDIEYDGLDFNEKIQVFEYILGKALNIKVFSYNREVTNEVFGVIELLATNEFIFNTDIAKRLNLKESHVELIQYLLCNNSHAEYGTSPRGLWLTEKGKKLYKTLLEWKE